MLSEPRDAIRWVEDYLRPAIESKEIDTKYAKTMEQTLKKCQAKAEKENQQQQTQSTKNKKQEHVNETDDEETETEEDDEESLGNAHRQNSRKSRQTVSESKKRSPPPSNKNRTSSKKKGKSDSSDSQADLIAKIRNKQGGNFMANLGARYGVNMVDQEDPLDDKEFAKIQSKLNKKRRS